MAAKKTVLVAEDDKYYLNIYKTKLAREGFEVITAEDGEQTLSAARQTPPSLSFLTW